MNESPMSQSFELSHNFIMYLFCVVFSIHRSKVQDYIRFHEDKEKGQGSHAPSRAPSLFTSAGGASTGGAAGGSGTMRMGGAAGGVMSGSHILVSLLRLRQCCGHLSLLKEVQ